MSLNDITELTGLLQGEDIQQKQLERKIDSLDSAIENQEIRVNVP